MYRYNAALSSAEFATVLGGNYRVWHGCGGCDHRPYVAASGKRLPVAYWSGDAGTGDVEAGDVEAGDVEGFLEALPLDTVVVVPDAYEQEDIEYMRTLHGWDRLDTVDVDMRSEFIHAMQGWDRLEGGEGK